MEKRLNSYRDIFVYSLVIPPLPPQTFTLFKLFPKFPQFHQLLINLIK